MNSAKKIMNQQKKEDKKSNHATAAKGTKKLSGNGAGDVKKIVLGAICAIIVLVLCIGVGVQQLKPKIVLKVNNTKITLDDMMYPIYERESRYLPYDEMYQMYTGSSVWDNSYMGTDRSVDSSATNSVGLKQEIINSETEYQVLYEEAKKAGYTLTDEDKDTVKDNVGEALKGLSWGQKLQLNISKNKLTKRFEKRTLADKYKADQQKELDKTVDEDAEIKDISKKDYREYKVQYYAVSTTTTDEDNKTKNLSKKEKADLLKKLQKVAEKAESAKDFTSLIDDKEEDIRYAEDSFTEKDGWSMISDKAILKQIKSMKNDEISKIFEDKKSGCYIFVKMIDNNSSDSYDEACKTAIQDAKNDAYDKWYEDVLKDYKVETDSEVWNEIIIGTVTTSIVTAEDLEKMSEDSSDATSE